MNAHPLALIAIFVVAFSGCVHAENPTPVPVSSNPGDAIPAAVQGALQLPEGNARTSALATAGAAWEKQDPRAALAWALTLPKSDGFNVVRIMANDWGDREPVPAKDWVMSQSQGHPLENGALSLLALHLIVTAWARHDITAAIAWAESQPTGTAVRSTAYYSVSDGWAQKDPTSAAAWAAKIPGDADRQIALAKAVNIWVRTGKPEEVAAWVEKLPVADMKSGVPDVARAFAKTDMEKAKVWVNGLPLSDADKSEILAKLK